MRLFTQKIIVIVALMMATTTADAQVSRWFRGKLLQKKKQTIVQNYVDSLEMYKAKLDSLQNAYEALLNQGYESDADGKYYQLFTPLTFYHQPAAQFLRLDNDAGNQSIENEQIENALMNVYLNRPDLVVNSENRLNEAGAVSTDITQPIKQDVELVETVEQLPEVVDSVPVDVMVKKPNFWTYKGDYYLQFLQNYISGNWYKGGESNYSMVASVVMEANYNNKQKVKFDNKLEMKLGFMTSKADSLHSFKTTEDLIRYTGTLGLQAKNKWYYTLQVQAYTQFYMGYKNNDALVYSDFMSPFNLNVSLGMDYSVEAFNKKLTGNIHIAPISYNFRYVDRLALSTRYGLDEGKHVLNDFGSLFNVDLEWAFSDNIKWKTRMYTYTTYKKVEFEWENTFVFKFNKYISSNLFLYPRFDDGVMRDDHHGYWQFKEFFSLGFNYSF